MEAKNAQTIVNEIYAHMQKQGGQLSDWYVGITSDIEQRLFTDHNVPRKNHWYAYRKATTADEARSAEKAFLDAGCDGGGVRVGTGLAVPIGPRPGGVSARR